jgi:hypothetical protein
MAKYIKFDLTANNPSPELLIPLDAITHCVTASATATDVFLSINNAASTKWRITHTTPLVATAVLSAIQDAQKANPGGVVSTVVGPIQTAQVPLAQTGSGRQVITTAAKSVTFTSAVFTA